MATTSIINAPVSLNGATPGAYSMTPLILPTHVDADIFNWYLGGINTSTVEEIVMVVENLAGTVLGAYPCTPNADTVSATFTAAGTEAWLATAGITSNAYITCVQSVDPSNPIPGASLVSHKVQFTTS
jgi:hypothetical protein